MCGLAGFVDPGRRLADPEGALAGMASSLAHRGPDGEGTWSGEGGIHLAHRRLAILDLGSGGAQPMASQSGMVIVFNGEIYNHAELRRILATDGHRFRTRSDTEVLLAAWERWGPDCLPRLNGMFAFALWDSRAGRLFLARDRLGKKPLYLHRGDGFLAFASEAKALLGLAPVRTMVRPDPYALADVLAMGYVLGDKSAWTGIERLSPAHWAEYDPASGSLRRHLYWNAAELVLDRRRPYDGAAREEFAALLDDAVRLRLEADVEVGCFLSGGLDSSAVAATAARVATTPPRAFCIGFAESSFDERRHALAVARHLGIACEVLEVEPGRDAQLARAIWHCDEPFADTSLVPTWALNQAAARRVKVALSGDGADEILAGYPTYRADALFRHYRWVPRPLHRVVEGAARRWLRPSYRKVSLDYKLRQFLAGHGLSPERAHAWWRVMFAEAERRDMLAPAVLAEIGEYDPLDAFDHRFAEVEGAHFLDRSLYVDIKTWLADDILVKADRMSMAHGLEVRSPFLDYRLVELALRLDPTAKMNGRRQKVILRDVMTGILPPGILARRKEGFGSPTRALGVEAPPFVDFPEIFCDNVRLDGGREDITYKAFCLAVITHWLRGWGDYRHGTDWLPSGS